jgi:hypothetical protein
LTVNDSAPDAGRFRAPLSVLPDSFGLYSAVVVARYRFADTDPEKACIVSTSTIVRKQPLSVNVPDPLSHDQAIAEYERYYESFLDMVRRGGLPAQVGSLYLSITKKTVADIFSRTFSGIDLSGRIDASKLSPQVSRARIKVPDPATISCAADNCYSTRACALRNDCRLNPDNRDCYRRTFFGGWDDPICLIGRGLENARRNFEYSVCQANDELQRLDCERLKGQENIACEVQRGVQKARCETERAVISLMTPNGDLADITGEFRFSGQATFAVVRMEVSDDLSGFVLNARYGADIRTLGRIKLVPLNVGGHIVGCIGTWDGQIGILARASPEEHAITGAVRLPSLKSKIVLNIGLPELPIRFSPPPLLALFEQNPSFPLTCPVLFTAGLGAGIFGLLTGGPEAGLLTGNVTLPAIKLDYEVEIDGIEVPPPFASYGWAVPKLNIRDDVTALTWR